MNCGRRSPEIGLEQSFSTSESSESADVESLHRDFLPCPCLHPPHPGWEMWMAALEAGAVDVCAVDDVSNVLKSVLRSLPCPAALLHRAISNLKLTGRGRLWASSSFAGTSAIRAHVLRSHVVSQHGPAFGSGYAVVLKARSPDSVAPKRSTCVPCIYSLGC